MNPIMISTHNQKKGQAIVGEKLGWGTHITRPHIKPSANRWIAMEWRILSTVGREISKKGLLVFSSQKGAVFELEKKYQKAWK